MTGKHSWCRGKIHLYLNSWIIYSFHRIKQLYSVNRTITESYGKVAEWQRYTFQLPFSQFWEIWMAEFHLVFVVLLSNKSLKENCEFWGQHSSKYSSSWSVRRRTVEIIRFTYQTKKHRLIWEIMRAFLIFLLIEGGFLIVWWPFH